MDRWTTSYQEFLSNKSWQSICNFTTDNDIKSVTDPRKLSEFARFEKVLDYLSTLLNTIDPQLIPIAVWDKLKSHANICEQELQSDMRRLHHANDTLDKMILEISHYRVSELSDEMISSITKNSLEIKKEVKTIRNYHDELFGESKGDQTNKSLKFQNFFDQAETQVRQINTSYQKLIVGSEGNDSIVTKITQAEQTLKDFDEEIGNFAHFYDVVFGYENENGDEIPGLKHELEQRRANLEVFKNEQSEIITALKNRIESLLPGATSAGLASAYKELKDQATKKHDSFFLSFMVVLGSLTFSSIFSYHYFGSLLQSSVNEHSIEGWLLRLLYSLPILMPLLWLALFLSKRRSEQQRLEQEYAHKEALATSFEGYKKQIQELKDNDETLLATLLETMINAIGKNAANTLDKHHGDSPPTIEAVKEVTGNLKKPS